jgi:hypothetical protein
MWQPIKSKSDSHETLAESGLSSYRLLIETINKYVHKKETINKYTLQLYSLFCLIEQDNSLELCKSYNEQFNFQGMRSNSALSVSKEMPFKFYLKLNNLNFDQIYRENYQHLWCQIHMYFENIFRDKFNDDTYLVS